MHRTCNRTPAARSNRGAGPTAPIANYDLNAVAFQGLGNEGRREGQESR